MAQERPRRNGLVASEAIRPRILALDADDQTRNALEELALVLRCDYRGYVSGLEFLAEHCETSTPSCLVLDVQLPDISGLMIQQRLTAASDPLSLIFLTASREVWLAVEVMRRGAVHYLLKPVPRLEIVSAIEEALVLSEARCAARDRRQWLQDRLGRLTPEDKHSLRMIADGMTARELSQASGITLRATEMRMRKLMEKLAFKHPMSLMRFALRVKREDAKNRDR